MKTCPFCAEQIQDAAIVCRYCGRDLTATPTGHKPERYNVILAGIDPHKKIQVIKEIRALTGLGLKESKDMSERPSLLSKEVTQEEALRLTERFERAGGRIELRDAAAPLPDTFIPPSAPAPQEITPAVKNCPNCSMPMPRSTRICPNCQQEVSGGFSLAQAWMILPVPLLLVILYLLYLLWQR